MVEATVLFVYSLKCFCRCPSHIIYCIPSVDDANVRQILQQALRMWKDEFQYFDMKYWNHTFDIQRQPGREENFAFVHQDVLFIGLNIVGGEVLNTSEWTTRLDDQFNWTKSLIGNYRQYVQHPQRWKAQANNYTNASAVIYEDNTNTTTTDTKFGRVVLFGHANPVASHDEFFLPLRNYIRDELRNEVPVLYVNGDQHRWSYNESFYNQPSFLRIMLKGGTSEPPLKVTVNYDGTAATTDVAFTYDRRLNGR